MSITYTQKVREHSELLYAQYLARCLEPGNVCHSITTRETSKRRMKETLFTRHRSTVEPMMLADNRKQHSRQFTLTQSTRLSKIRKRYSVRCSSTLRKRPNQEGTHHPRTFKIRILHTPSVSISVLTAARRHKTSNISSLARLIRRH